MLMMYGVMMTMMMMRLAMWLMEEEQGSKLISINDVGNIDVDDVRSDDDDDDMLSHIVKRGVGKQADVDVDDIGNIDADDVGSDDDDVLGHIGNDRLDALGLALATSVLLSFPRSLPLLDASRSLPNPTISAVVVPSPLLELVAVELSASLDWDCGSS
ncbi:hypothetical protein OPV22_009493 [Ensete ventricosum]|uniref:Uncharacterized protein n=1 Tax=Ensete ventricosum TaxID=4639 RepID=A0AAV8RIK6_ENSVE|nr:hypothetical protein OPV22_009493 [Ensete ventricosum]